MIPAILSLVSSVALLVFVWTATQRRCCCACHDEHEEPPPVEFFLREVNPLQEVMDKYPIPPRPRLSLLTGLGQRAAA